MPPGIPPAREHMVLAFFRDEAARDRAVTAATAQPSIHMRYIGTVQQVVEGFVRPQSHPVVIFQTYGSKSINFFKEIGALDCDVM